MLGMLDYCWGRLTLRQDIWCYVVHALCLYWPASRSFSYIWKHMSVNIQELCGDQLPPTTTMLSYGLWIAWWTSWICMEIVTIKKGQSMMIKTIMEYQELLEIGSWLKQDNSIEKQMGTLWVITGLEWGPGNCRCNPSHWTTSLAIACSSFNYVHAMFMLWKTLHWRLHVNWLGFWNCRVATCLTLRYSLGNGNHPVPVAGIQLERSGAESRNKII